MLQKRLTVHIDNDLATFIREMAHTNGISIQKYTNNLLDKAIIQEKGSTRPCPRPWWLDRKESSDYGYQ